MTRQARLPARLVEFARSRDLLSRGSRVLVAVSGGPDSMVLLRLLVQARKALGIDLAVGHVDHGLRAISKRDAAFVERQATALGLPFLSRRVDVRERARRTGASIETAAREARYEALRDLAIEAVASRIATGHTASDQAETVLMRLLRGTGPLGLAGIEANTSSGIARPLLCTTADEVRQYAVDQGIATRDDATNRDPRHFRNRVRSMLLPMLRVENPRIDFLLADLAEDAAALSLAIGEAVRVEPGTGEVRLPRPTGPDPLLPYRVRAAYEQATGAPLGLSRTHLVAVTRLLTTAGATGEVHLPRRVVAIVGRDGLRLHPVKDGPPPGSRRRTRVADEDRVDGKPRE